MIDAGLSEAEARRRFYAVDRDGLLVEGMAGHHPGPGALRAATARASRIGR